MNKLFRWLHEKLNRCSYCHWRKAVWFYMPSDDFEIACDKCVPRGCSCNDFPVDKEGNGLCYFEIEGDHTDWKPYLDEQGREYPCCEWLYSDNKDWEKTIEKNSISFEEVIRKTLDE